MIPLNKSRAEPITLITGGTRGLGLDIAKTLLQRGKRVFVLSRNQSIEFEELASNNSGNIFHLSVDLGKTSDFTSIVKEVESFGAVENLILNAAIGSETLFVLKSPSEIENHIRVNFTAPVLLARAVAKRLILRRQGTIVIISSIAARRAYRGLALYGASKAGLEQFAKGLALELGRFGIRVNCVAPGFLDTEMTQSIGAPIRAAIARRSALQRLSSLDSVTHLVCALLSEELRDATGSVFSIDCGSDL